MTSPKTVSEAMLSSLDVQTASSPHAEKAELKRFGTLPPVGAPIAFTSILASLWDSIRGIADRGDDALLRRLTNMTGLQYWVFTNSGRAALSTILMALHARRPECDEVIIPAYTSYSVPAAVVRAGLKIRLCDVEGETLGLDPDVLKTCITPRTLCVLPHHLYGLPSRIAAATDIAKVHGLPLIEDAAQGLGITCQGQSGGSHGAVGIFSLSRGKNLPAAGGGVIGTNNPEIAEACRRTVGRPSRTFGLPIREAVNTSVMAAFIRPALYWLPASLPFLKLGQSWFEPTFDVSRMSEFQYALFNRLLPNLQTLQRLRREQAVRLREALAGAPLQFLWPRQGDEGAFLRAPVIVRDRVAKEQILSELQRRALGATEGYPLALSHLPQLRPYMAALASGCPKAEWISERLITLPTHHWVTDSHRRTIAEVVMRCM